MAQIRLSATQDQNTGNCRAIVDFLGAQDIVDQPTPELLIKDIWYCYGVELAFNGDTFQIPAGYEL